MVFPAVAMRGVDLSLGRGAARVHILRDVALTIGKGEAVGIIGASGSGKSTLLMIMAGLERPDKGEVEIDGVKMLALVQADGSVIILEGAEGISGSTAQLPNLLLGDISTHQPTKSVFGIRIESQRLLIGFDRLCGLLLS